MTISKEDKSKNGLTYKKAGVDSDSETHLLPILIDYARRTEAFRTHRGKSLLDIGYYANVIDLTHEQGLAVSVDGVGTKIIVAQMMERYDTVGIDCIAMNVNDIICVGAEPIAFLDYLAVADMDSQLIEQLAKGLYEGARQAKVTIPGGETAQVRELLSQPEKGAAFDLVGMALGTVAKDKIILGEALQEGDLIIGLASSGIHSNGYTLARKVAFDVLKLKPDSYIEELGRTIGEELLIPTAIYVQPIVALLDSGIECRALCHITGGGFLNLLRVKSEMSFIIDNLPELQPIFKLLQKAGKITHSEMYRTFNMGIGFCIVISPKDKDKVTEIFRSYRIESYIIGHIEKETKKRVVLSQIGLASKDNRFIEKV